MGVAKMKVGLTLVGMPNFSATLRSVAEHGHMHMCGNQAVYV